MDGIIVIFIVISVIISIINGITKQAKKTANSPQSRVYFPPLSVDSLQDTQISIQSSEDYCEGSRIVSAEGIGEEGLTSMEAANYTLKQISISEDTSIEKRSPDIDLQILRADAYKKTEIAQVTQEEPSMASRLKLFENQDEFVKAVIYSEILKPRFKH